MSKQEVACLVRDLRHADWTVRKAAAYRMGKIGSRGKQMISTLVIALQDENPRVRETAARALGGDQLQR
jgi:HEAT repeat protein